MKRKEKIRKIIKVLRKNSRATLTDISKATGIPISTIYENLKVIDSSVVKKYACLLDFTKFGYTTKAVYLLKTSPIERNHIIDYLKGHPNINTLYRINNDFEIHAECYFRNIKEVQQFLEDIDQKFNVMDSRLYFVIEEVMFEEMVPTLKTL